MSGFVGILRTDGVAAARDIVDSLTRSLEFRGPDGTDLRVEGPVGLGHTLLRVGAPHPRERQPATLDGSAWVVGDIRIDAQADLIDALRGCFRSVPNDATDAELVLHSYGAWGEACPEHLLGDFAFAIWDSRRERLFCARDQMGVKPFYYAQSPGQMVFGNTIDCLRRHPEVPGDLNELAIADFLLFGCNLDVGRTTFAHIRCLPPAHTLVAARGDVQLRRYWTLPIDEPVYYKRSADYVDRFRELLATAVGDRLRTDRVAVFMSGGLDSTLLAAEARAQLPAADSVSAFTGVYDRLIPDVERHYAGMVAAHLRIPIRFWALDDDSSSTGRPGSATCPPEAVAEPEAYEAGVERFREMALRARVAFFGEGPDNALHYEWQPYLSHLWRNGRWGRMVGDIGRHAFAHRRLPLLPTVPAMFRARQVRKSWKVPFPEWLNAELVQRYELRRRWEEWWQPPARAAHPMRPNGYRSMGTPLWVRIFEGLDPGWTRSAIVVRHPYLDLRLLRFLLSVPAMPWCRDKFLLRSAGRGILPGATLSRPKSPLRANPGFARDKGIVGQVSPDRAGLLAPFVEPVRLQWTSARSEVEYNMARRAYDLGWWLDCRTLVGDGGGETEFEEGKAP